MRESRQLDPNLRGPVVVPYRSEDTPGLRAYLMVAVAALALSLAVPTCRDSKPVAQPSPVRDMMEKALWRN